MITDTNNTGSKDIKNKKIDNNSTNNILGNNDIQNNNIDIKNSNNIPIFENNNNISKNNDDHFININEISYISENNNNIQNNNNIDIKNSNNEIQDSISINIQDNIKSGKYIPIFENNNNIKNGSTNNIFGNNNIQNNNNIDIKNSSEYIPPFPIPNLEYNNNIQNNNNINSKNNERVSRVSLFDLVDIANNFIDEVQNFKQQYNNNNNNNNNFNSNNVIPEVLEEGSIQGSNSNINIQNNIKNSNTDNFNNNNIFKENIDIKNSSEIPTLFHFPENNNNIQNSNINSKNNEYTPIFNINNNIQNSNINNTNIIYPYPKNDISQYFSSQSQPNPDPLNPGKKILSNNKFNYEVEVEVDNENKEKRKFKYISKVKREKKDRFFLLKDTIRQIPENIDLFQRPKFIPSENRDFKRQFINGLTKRDLIIFCILTIITIIIALRYLAFLYYESELEMMKNQSEREKKIFIFKKIKEDPFFKINKKKVFLAGAISLLMTAIILYLSVKKRD